MTLTDEVRAFNRFYTLKIGLLNRSLPATDLSLPEARVLYELAQTPEEAPDMYIDFDETGPYEAITGESECAT